MQRTGISLARTARRFVHGDINISVVVQRNAIIRDTQKRVFLRLRFFFICALFGCSLNRSAIDFLSLSAATNICNDRHRRGVIIPHGTRTEESACTVQTMARVRWLRT